jgi:primosomal protein N' (replication factor Y) (superfamily II helicase)
VEPIYLTIALDTPLDRLFDYRWEASAGEPTPHIGQIALVPFGKQEMAGLIVGISNQTSVPADKIKQVLAIRHQCTALNTQWIDLCRFAADYYQRPLGEVAIPALPKNLRVPKTTSLERNLKKLLIRNHS